MNWYIAVLKKYAVFDGRAGRHEYCMFVAINFLISLLLGILNGPVMGGDTPAIPAVYNLLVFLPAVGVNIRRLHDTNRSGWWLVLLFVPIIGGIVLIILMMLPDDKENNRFGDAPLGQV